MKIIIPRVSDATTQRAMRSFINTALQAWFRLPFSSPPTIVSCRIIAITNRAGTKQRHGVINVIPDDAARRIIRKLNGERLMGKRVAVTQFDGDFEELSVSKLLT